MQGNNRESLQSIILCPGPQVLEWSRRFVIHRAPIGFKLNIVQKQYMGIWNRRELRGKQLLGKIIEIPLLVFTGGQHHILLVSATQAEHSNSLLFFGNAPFSSP